MIGYSIDRHVYFKCNSQTQPPDKERLVKQQNYHQFGFRIKPHFCSSMLGSNRKNTIANRNELLYFGDRSGLLQRMSGVMFLDRVHSSEIRANSLSNRYISLLITTDMWLECCKKNYNMDSSRRRFSTIFHLWILLMIILFWWIP